jgi:hypothetical protein
VTWKARAMTALPDRAPVYPPLDKLKPVAPDLWIVDSGPLRAMGVAIPVRMTVVRLSSGDLWLHSPTRYEEGLRHSLEQVGPIRHLVAPNVAHWSYIKEWQARCADTTTWAVPGLRDGRQVRKEGIVLDRDLTPYPPPEWSGDIDQVIVEGGFGVSEAAFLHVPSRTLILTDLIENFEPQKLSVPLRIILRLLGTTAPDGRAPAYYRFVMTRRRKSARAAARRMVDWAPERVIFAHGRWFTEQGTAGLKKSLRWLLG